ncbi:MAG: cyclopropane-fatty-acyl-phospholipid synthase family protein [Pirellula sp.]
MSQSLLEQTIEGAVGVGKESLPESFERVVKTDRSWKGRLERFLIARALDAVGNPPIAVQLGDRLLTADHTKTLSTRVIIRDVRTLIQLALDPLLQFGDAYTDGRIEVKGDLAGVLSIILQAQARCGGRRSFLERSVNSVNYIDRNTLVASRNNIHHHYDLGNDFYRLWLDDQLVYTCAYFPEMTATLEQAQQAKMELICRKLKLQAGETVVEAGCGWGALALYMAKNYGVRVHAFNISREQIEYARQRSNAEGLEDRVCFVEDDWREIRQPCDAFVSVGMLEHVGAVNYAKLGEVICRCVKAKGRGLIHSIGQTHPEPLNPWIERRIFPGAYPPTLGQIVGIFEPNDLAVLDVENLRLHYALTLKHWHNRFEASVDKVAGKFDEAFVRMWRLYLVGSMVAFECGSLHLFQVLFSRDNNNEIPWTRAEIYQTPLEHRSSSSEEEHPCKRTMF